MEYLGKPMKLIKVIGKQVYLQWISTPFVDSEGGKTPIGVDVNSNTIFMVWDKNLKNINTDVINFVLWHEVGHIVLGHYNKTSKRDERVEEEADSFARERSGNITFNKNDVYNFYKWLGNTCGKIITESYIENQCKRFGI